MKKRFMALSLVLSFVVAMSLEAFAALPSQSVINYYNNPSHNDPYTGYPQYGSYREVSQITMQDLKRLEQVVNGESVNGKTLGPVHAGEGAKIVNAKQLSNTEWVIRLDNDGTQSAAWKGDYHVFAVPYQTNADGQPFNVPSKADTVKYGPSWFYCGLFDDVRSHGILGFAVAVRIKRWPEKSDLSYTTNSEPVLQDKNGNIVNGETKASIAANRMVLDENGIAKREYPQFELLRDHYIAGSYNEKSDINFLANHGVK